MTLQELFVVARLNRERDLKVPEAILDAFGGVTQQLAIGFHSIVRKLYEAWDLPVEKFLPSKIRKRTRSKEYDRGASAATQRALILASVRPQS